MVWYCAMEIGIRWLIPISIILHFPPSKLKLLLGLSFWVETCNQSTRMTLELIANHVAMSICHVLEFILGIFWEVWTCPRTLLKSSLNSTFQFQFWQTWGLTWTEQFEPIRKKNSNRESHIGVQLSHKLTLIVKSWKTHREFFLKLSISGSWARPFTWKLFH